MNHKPLLKWAGGKRSIVDQIENMIKNIDTTNATFYDLFAGSGSVSFYLSSYFSQIVMNDTNSELHNMYNI